MLRLPHQTKIHRSLISKWKREDLTKYYGYELNYNVGELYEVLKKVSDDELIQKLSVIFYRINRILKDSIGVGREYFSRLKEHNSIIVRVIQNSKDTIGISKCIRLFGIAKSIFRTWSIKE